MAIDNSAKKTRDFLKTHNKYQRKIILLAFIPGALIFMAFICIVFIGAPNFSKAIFHTSFWNLENSVNQISGLLVLLMCLIFLFSMIQAFIISHKMLGAYERIIRELDEIISGRSQKTIKGRPYDTLTNDLLKHINVLVEFYRDNKKKDL